MMRRPRRSGFTLLELLLATLIASLLLSSLYFLMNITLRQTQDARDAVEIDAVARGAFNRMTLDLSTVLGPLPPKSGGNNDNAASGAPTTTPTTTDPGATSTDPNATTTDPSATTDPNATTDPSATGDETAAEATPVAADVPFQGGLVGTDKQFTFFASRVPEPLTNANAMLQSSDPLSGVVPHDLRRISYWLGENGGLCRQVQPWVTAEGIRNSTDPDRSNEAADTILEEVTDLSFEYFDGMSWTTTWDGSAPGPDGITPMGPPRAIRATLVFEFKTSPTAPPLERTVSHVIPIRTAPGLLTLAFIDPATDTGTGTEDTTGSGTDTTGTGSGGGTTTPSTGGTGGGATGGTSTGGATGAGGRTPTTGGGTMTPASGGGGTGGAAPTGGGSARTGGTTGGGGGR